MEEQILLALARKLRALPTDEAAALILRSFVEGVVVGLSKGATVTPDELDAILKDFTRTH